jgi:hypothetical protein
MSGEALCSVISRNRYNYSDEIALQDGIEQVLRDDQIAFVREKAATKAERPDFIVDPGIALEVKIKGGTAALIRQIYRYAKLPEINEIVVVTSRSRLASLPEEIAGKPIRVVTLAGSAFV